MTTEFDEPLRPHLFPGELDLFLAQMRAAGSYLEFGCGGSTVTAVENGVQRIVSVDSDPAWIEKVKARVPAHRVVFVHGDIGEVAEWGNPLDKNPSANWPLYFLKPWRYFTEACETPDLIYVDGRFRVACALYSAIMLQFYRKGRTARIMIHDYPERPYFHRVEKYLKIVDASVTLAVFEPLPALPLSEIFDELLNYQFDYR